LFTRVGWKKRFGASLVPEQRVLVQTRPATEFGYFDEVRDEVRDEVEDQTSELSSAQK